MCYLPVKAIPIGATLVEPVVANGEDLFPKGTRVNLNVKETLVKFGVKDVKVQTYLNTLNSGEAVDIDNVDDDYLKRLAHLGTEDIRAFSSMLVSKVIANSDKYLLNALKLYDKETYQHSVNVATLCCVFGIHYGLSYEDLVDLVKSGVYHDIGKLGISTDILHKPGRLDDDEFQIMKWHASIGFDALSANPNNSKRMLLSVLEHHENYDGSGYPRGVSSKYLTLFGQIIHLCDVYDALCSPRPYKTAFSHKEAQQYMYQMSGKMFNPGLVNVFNRCIPLYHLGEVLNICGHTGIVVAREGDDYVLVRCDNKIYSPNEFYASQQCIC